VILTSRCEPGFTQQEHFSALVWFDGSWHLLHLLPPQWSVTLGGESLRSIAFDFNKRGIKPAGGTKNGESKIDKWQGSILRRVLLSPRIAGRTYGEVVGKAVWPATSPSMKRLMIAWSGC
jgi:hypothetical protein